MTQDNQENLFETLPANVFQVLIQHQQKKDMLNLRATCKTIKQKISKSPTFLGQCKKAEYIRKVRAQEAALFKQQRSKEELTQALLSDKEQMVARYRALLQVLNGEDANRPNDPVIAQLQQRAGQDRFDILPVMARLKLEIIRELPDDHTLFHNIHRQETRFDYTSGLRTIHACVTLGIIAGVLTFGTLGASLVLAALTLNMMVPYIALGTALAIICFAIGGYYGTEHRKGLQRFVLDDKFLAGAEKSADTTVVAPQNK